ncbi:MAG TPA: carboxymuconolactone decarboxylase family protein [Gammaproteobacteria bacterium]|nr:carboxymuconolactone decarboxylase family protein [Gammaproteobacteria bacterium]
MDAGLTVNESKEILVQLYAHAGFPRSLNAIQAFMAVMEERQAGAVREKDAGPLPSDMDRDEYGAQVRARLAGLEDMPAPTGFQLFAPVIDRFLKEHLFADILARDNPDYQSRELATIAALASMTGTTAQLRFHLGAAMNTGLTESQVKDFVSVLESRVGSEQTENASAALAEVLRARMQ